MSTQNSRAFSSHLIVWRDGGCQAKGSSDSLAGKG